MSFDAVLDGLCQTAGLVGALLLDDSGHVVARRLPSVFESGPLAEVTSRVRSTFDVLSALEEGGPEELTLVGDDGLLALRRVHSHWLLVLGDPSLNLAILNVALQVAALGLERELSNRMPSAEKSVEPPPELEPRREVESTVIDAVPFPVVRALLDLYAEHLGPAARPIFKQELAGLGASSRSLRRRDLGAFVARLTERIPVSSARHDFARGARAYGERMLLF